MNGRIVENLDVVVEIWIVGALCGAGGFLGSYLKRKGENLATHEDIDQLVEQVRAVTTATKEIEAKISSDVWDRQKRWELKREVLFEITKRIAAVKSALFDMGATYAASVGNDSTEQEEKNAASKRVFEAASSFDQATLLAKLVCGEKVNRLLHTFVVLVRRTAKEISKRETEAVKISTRELQTQADAVAAAMRQEIGIEGTN